MVMLNLIIRSNGVCKMIKLKNKQKKILANYFKYMGFAK